MAEEFSTLHTPELQSAAAALRQRLNPAGRSRPLVEAGAWREHDASFGAFFNDLALVAGYGDDALDLRTRALCTISSILTLGETAYAESWMHNALNAGATPQEIASLLRQLVFYIGSPRAASGFEALRRVLAGRADESTVGD